MLSARLFVFIGVFLSDFFDIAHYACEKSNENPLLKSLWIYGSGHHYPCLNVALYGAQNEAYMSRSAEKWVRGLCFNELGVCG